MRQLAESYDSAKSMRNQTPQTGFSSWGGGVKGSFSHLYRSILVNVLSQSEKGEVGKCPFVACDMF